LAVPMKMGYGDTWFDGSVMAFRKNRMRSIFMVDK